MDLHSSDPNLDGLFSRRRKGSRSTDIPASFDGRMPPPFDSVAGQGMQKQHFTWETLKRDAPAGMITGLMAIPLNIGIALLSDYPIQIAIFTVVVACCVGFLCSLVRPGNYIGVPGVAAGLAPVLAIGVHRYGMETMPWIIFLVAVSQLIVWKFRLEGYILKAVPHYLVEGLLAGVGLKIAMKFLPYTYEVTAETAEFWSPERTQIVLCSAVAFVLFVWMYKKLKDKSPGLPYIVIIGASALLATEIPFPLLQFEPVDIGFAPPFPDFAAFSPVRHVEIILFAMMLSSVDIIEQVMSNAAIEKIDPLQRKTDSNSSLLAIWLANLVSSTFGGMTNLDGLAKSSTNRMAGAVTKMSALFVAGILSIVLLRPDLLHYLPNFALAVLMIFTGWKMIAGLYHVAHQGKYEFGLAVFCGILVFRLGIFEGLLIALATHSFITYLVYRASHVRTIEILRKFIALFSSRTVHPHATPTLNVHDDLHRGVCYASTPRSPTARKDLDSFIGDWADAIDHHNLLGVVSCYAPDSLLWGTFAKDLRAGPSNVKRYFEHLFELEELHVKFESGETRQYDQIFIRSGTYVFSYRKKGAIVHVPARYSLVCKRERTGWYIVEHHSSEFPAG